MEANQKLDSDNKSGYRWQAPKGDSLAAQKPQLRISNSFTKKKEIFVPNVNGEIKWYSCGPTVYDVAHLGHARSYITFDILRRILSEYFGFRVFYVMNITDIDDKIIKRARSCFLSERFIEQALNGQIEHQNLLCGLKSAVENYETRRKDEKDPAKVEMFSKVLKKSNEAIKKLEISLSKKPDNFKALKVPLEDLKDVIADEEDMKYGHTVTDHKIFKTLTSKFEQEFHEDMYNLDVQLPEALPRVSEYIDRVGDYIKRLEENGYAYRSCGSIYFDTEKFDSDPRHSYAKLVRENYGLKKSLDDGEGELSLAHQGRKSPNDFALWKRSKPGEPSWSTADFEPGRPGWHIECSVMASHWLGDNFDIHSGGCDLKFPHHDNEIAQAEAYYNTGNNWVNYFIHSGHLTIAGCKMSKSLKNFVTIRQALQEHSSRQLRFLFLSHGWAETLDYSSNSMRTAKGYEKKFKEFFMNVLDVFKQRQNVSGSEGYDDKSVPHGSKASRLFGDWTESDKLLDQEFITSIRKVDVAMCDNFDTRTVLNNLCTLMKECNKRPESSVTLLGEIALFVGRILRIMGAKFEECDQIADALQKGCNNNSTSKQLESTGGNSASLIDHLELWAKFRGEVRNILKSKPKPMTDYDKQILSLCDDIRNKMPTLGVKLEDGDGANYKLKML